MANIAQQPNKYNSAYVPNVWVLDGLSGADRYTLKVLINSQVVATFKQPANPSGVGIFDVSKVLQSYLEVYFDENITRASDTPGTLMSYQIEASTETGTSPGEAVLSDTKFVINAYDNWRVLNSDLTPFLPNPQAIVCENTNVNARYASPLRYLTNYPGEYSVKLDEYHTLSFFAINTNVGPLWGPNEAPFFVSVTYYNAAGTQLAQGAYAIANANGSTLRANCQDMTVNGTNNNAITTIGTGPKNFTDGGIVWDNNWASYKVEVYSYNHCVNTTISNCNSVSEIIDGGYLGDVIYTATFNVDYSCEKFEPITISFMNQYGVKDYYTFTKRNTRQVATNRNEYTRPIGSWSSTSFAIDPHERGRTVFSSYSDTEMTLSTNWMQDNVSEWLRELYQSPSVMIYTDGQWEPVVITSGTYEEKTYAREQLFQHEITVKYANNQKIQRG